MYTPSPATKNYEQERQKSSHVERIEMNNSETVAMIGALREEIAELRTKLFGELVPQPTDPNKSNIIGGNGVFGALEAQSEIIRTLLQQEVDNLRQIRYKI